MEKEKDFEELSEEQVDQLDKQELRELILFKCKKLQKTYANLIFNILANLDKQDEVSLLKINQYLSTLLSEAKCVERRVSLWKVKNYKL